MRFVRHAQGEPVLNRRYFLAGAASVTLGACSSISGLGSLAYAPGTGNRLVVTGEPYDVPSVNLTTIPVQYHRQTVNDPTGEAPGTIVVDPGQRYLYLVLSNGKARRYGIGVGRQGFAWNGNAVIGAKREWPKWFPPVEMQARDERAKKFANGMEAGPDNPLGARAMYLFQGGRDTLYRIHGTNEPESIGKAVSSGCIRMLNADVIDLYGRVPVGTKVVVLSASNPIARLGKALTDPDAQWRQSVRRMAGQPQG
jgi:lipoprotein-anchoring transpeptidase ErfK/SrfK